MIVQSSYGHRYEIFAKYSNFAPADDLNADFAIHTDLTSYLYFSNILIPYTP